MRPNVFQLFGLAVLRRVSWISLPESSDKRLLTFVQTLNGGLHACHHAPIEFHLLAHVPIQRARHAAL